MSLARRILLLTAVLLFGGCGPDPSARPNVLLIVVDTLRADELSCYGGEAPVSPAICALAERGALFERALAATAYTAPSHATIMTSRYPRRSSLGYSNGRTRLRDETTIAQLFERAGWATAAFVSNVILKPRIGLNKGFAVYDADLPVSEPTRRGVFERTAPLTTARAVDWLAAAPARPFFLWVHYQDPHGPYAPPLSFQEMFPARPERDPPLPAAKDNFGLGGIPGYQRLPGLDRPSQYRTRYHGEVRYLDRSVGALIAAARNADPTRPLVVLLTADHGESFGENGFYFAHGHATTPDQVHVPLILEAPGVQPARRAELVSHVDVMSTLLELAGLDVPDGAEGLALGPAVRSGRPLPERTLFADIGYELAAFRGDRFHVVGGPPKSFETDAFYKEGKANRLDALMTAADLTRRTTYLWQERAWAESGLDAGLDAAAVQYLGGSVTAGDEVEISPEDRARMRALGYVE
jgi:arylsulfatase A-like enzyme